MTTSEHPAEPAAGHEQDVPPRPEEEVADAAQRTDDDEARPGGTRTRPTGNPGRMPAYPASPPPLDGPITSPSPDLADPDYSPPDYPTEASPTQSAAAEPSEDARPRHRPRP